MKTARVSALTAVVAVLSLAAAQAAEVKVEGLHICCPTCVTDIEKALTGIDGVPNVASSKDTKIATFEASDQKAAEAGVKALAGAGLHGTATYEGKEIAMPDSGFKDGKEKDMTIHNVYMCCKGCIGEVTKAVQAVEGVDSAAADQKARTLTVKAKGGSKEGFDQKAVIAALNKAGFHGTERSGKEPARERKSEKKEN